MSHTVNPLVETTGDQVSSLPYTPTSYDDLYLDIRPFKIKSQCDEMDVLIANLYLSPKGPRLCTMEDILLI